MNIGKVAKLVNKYVSLVKFAIEIAVKSLDEAKQVLGISPGDLLTEDLLKSKYRSKVLESHPDRGGSEDMIKRVNSAKEFLDNHLKNPTFKDSPHQDFEEEDFQGPNLSYEDIAAMRDEMGREEFNRRFPSWLSELKSEMGLAEYNRIFEGYDPNYEPEMNAEWASKQRVMEENIRDIIANSLEPQLDALESKIDNDELTNEEKIFLINNIEDGDALEAFLNDLTGQSSELTTGENSVLKYISEREYNKEKRMIITDLVKNKIKYNFDSFIELVSLGDIIKNPKFIFLFNRGIHLRKPEVEKLITQEFKDFIARDMAGEYSNRLQEFKEKRNLTRSDLMRKCHLLANKLVEYFKSKGETIPNTSWLSMDLFGGIAEKFPEMFQELVDLANPVNY